jgi:hypothetical protein
MPDADDGRARIVRRVVVAGRSFHPRYAADNPFLHGCSDDLGWPS